MSDATDGPIPFTKRPVTISAMIWNGHNIHAVQAFTGPSVAKKDGERLRIKTLEGAIYASPGDYVIRGVQGEFYPCKPDIFASTYIPSPGGSPTTA